MNTKAPHWIQYIAHYRKPAPAVTVADAPPLAVVAKPTLLASVRLADKIRYVDGKRVVSEQWSGTAYKVTGTQGDYTLLEYGNGVIGRKTSDLKIA